MLRATGKIFEARQEDGKIDYIEMEEFLLGNHRRKIYEILAVKMARKNPFGVTGKMP